MPRPRKPLADWGRFIVGSLLFLLLSGASPLLGHPVDMEALAMIESSNNPKAYNARSQARGLYQITPIVLKHWNQTHGDSAMVEDLFVPKENTMIANWYLNWLYDRCLTVKDTLISYNWGIGHWRRWRKAIDKFPPTKEELELYGLPKETQDYLDKYEKLTEEKL